MSQGRGRGKASKGVLEFRPYVTRVIPVGARVVCADNTGAKTLEIVNVHSIIQEYQDCLLLQLVIFVMLL